MHLSWVLVASKMLSREQDARTTRITQFFTLQHFPLLWDTFDPPKSPVQQKAKHSLVSPMEQKAKQHLVSPMKQKAKHP